MNELLFGFAWNAVAISAVLAALAWGVQRRLERPTLAYALWLLVLIKLMLPGLIAVPGVELPMPATFRGGEGLLHDGFAFTAESGAELHGDAGLVPALAEPDDLTIMSPGMLGVDWGAALGGLWLLGSLLVLAVSSARVLRFGAALRRASRDAPTDVQRLTESLAKTLDLKCAPRVLITRARLSPLVWWSSGSPVVVLPELLTQPERAEELRWALAHELGHLRRNDHMVRWLEWLAVVVFWWNPVAWWARKNLRLNEEICCDRLVIERFAPQPKAYANSLLNVVEFLARPTLRPPGLASALDSGGALEKRLTMILKKENGHCPRWMRALSLAAAIAILPMGFAEAQQRERGHDRPERSEQEPERTISKEEYQRAAERIKMAIESGRISAEDGKKRLAEMRKMVRSDAKPEASREMSKEQYEAAAARIKAALEAGKISYEDAEKRMMELRKSMGKQQEARELAERERRAAVEKEMARIKQAYEAGELTREEADKKMEALRKRAQSESARGDGRERMEIQMQRIKRAYEEGVLTQEEAERKMAELKKRFESERQRESRERAKPDAEMEKQIARIKQAHEDGVLTREEAGRKIAELKQRYQREHDRRDREHDRKDGGDQAKSISAEQYRAYAARIKAAVEAGELSPEDAKRKLIELRKQVRDRN